MNFDNLLIHSSAFSKLVTEPKSAADKAAGLLSATTKTHLKEIYLEKKYGRRKDITTKQMEKGILQEEEAITLYCRVKGKYFVKNETRVDDHFITGIPDLSDNEDIMKTKKGVDIKCSWSIFTFPFPDDKLSPAYDWQDQCYMRLTGAQDWGTAHCLVNAPPHLIVDEKRKLFYAMGAPEQDSIDYPKYQRKCVDVEKSMIFNMAEYLNYLKEHKITYDFDVELSDWVWDIPLKERVIEFEVKRDEAMIQSIPGYVMKSRKYLNDIANGIF